MISSCSACLAFSSPATSLHCTFGFSVIIAELSPTLSLACSASSPSPFLGCHIHHCKDCFQHLILLSQTIKFTLKLLIFSFQIITWIWACLHIIFPSIYNHKTSIRVWPSHWTFLISISHRQRVPSNWPCQPINAIWNKSAPATLGLLGSLLFSEAQNLSEGMTLSMQLLCCEYIWKLRFQGFHSFLRSTLPLHTHCVVTAAFFNLV